MPNEHISTLPPSRSAYVNHKCRCADCRKANTEHSKKWQQNNPDKHREHMVRYAIAHKSQIRSYQRKWEQRNRVKRVAKNSRWLAKNPHKAAEYQAKNRSNGNTAKWQLRYRQSANGRKRRHIGWMAYHARKNRAEGTTSLEQLDSRWMFYGHRCYLCGLPATTTDHVIPLSKGGSHWPANLRPACKSCNSRKRNMTLSEFHARQQTDC